MCIVYVDDLILWAMNDYNIHDLVMELQDLVDDLNKKMMPLTLWV